MTSKLYDGKLFLKTGAFTAAAADATLRPAAGKKWHVIALGIKVGLVDAQRTGTLYMYDGTTLRCILPTVTIDDNENKPLNPSIPGPLYVDRHNYLRFDTSYTGTDADGEFWGLVQESFDDAT